MTTVSVRDVIAHAIWKMNTNMSDLVKFLRKNKEIKKAKCFMYTLSGVSRVLQVGHVPWAPLEGAPLRGFSA